MIFQYNREKCYLMLKVFLVNITVAGKCRAIILFVVCKLLDIFKASVTCISLFRFHLRFKAEVNFFGNFISENWHTKRKKVLRIRQAWPTFHAWMSWVKLGIVSVNCYFFGCSETGFLGIFNIQFPVIFCCHCRC